MTNLNFCYDFLRNYYLRIALGIHLKLIPILKNRITFSGFSKNVLNYIALFYIQESILLDFNINKSFS